MLQNLKYWLIATLAICVIFTGCMVSYVWTNNELLGCERSRNNLSDFSNAYNKAFQGILGEAENYITTGEASSKYAFTNYISNFISVNNININYIRFSNQDELNNFEPLSGVGEFSAQEDYFFSLDNTEQDLFLSYLTCYNRISDVLIAAVETGDIAALRSDELANLCANAAAYRAKLTNHFATRVKDSAAALTNRLQFIVAFTIFVGAVLAAFVFKIVLLYMRNNRYNAYFNQLYSKAIENSNVGMAIVDKYYKYEYMNARYRGMLNIQIANPIGQTSFAVLPEEISASLPSHSFSQSHKNVILSYPQDGDLRYVSYNCFSIFDANDEPKFVTLIQDCTESCKKDNELKQQLKTIEFFANAKAAFLANVSHEIKTPLNIIIGMSHILKDSKLDEKQLDSLSKIHTSSELLLNIINDVLDISKIQKSTFVLYPSDFNLFSMLNESEDIFRPIVQNKGLKLIKEINISPDLCLNTDKTRLAQVLLNLVNNSCKFTTTGFIRIQLDKLEEKGSSVLLKFCVEDTGLGIEEEDASRVFQEFEQLENHLTKQHQGTGLGLAICKHIVNAMGGDIWVESTKGHGSKFYFTIWARQSSPEACISLPAIETLPTLDGHGERVLVVEDTELNYEVTQNILESCNIQCDHAWDGQEAIDMCVKLPPDYYKVILMDIHMPNMDGYTAAEILKTEIGIVSPIVALTATNIEADTRETYKGIIDDFLGKPFRCQEFHRTLLPYFSDYAMPSAASIISATVPTVVPKRLPPAPLPKLSANEVKANESIGKEIRYLNLEEAAAALGCSEKQYIKHLTKFKTAYAHVDEDIQELLSDQNYAEAHRIAHSVKGLAGTLGLLPLQQMAAELEAALREESEAAKTLLPVFKVELNGICQEHTECN